MVLLSNGLGKWTLLTLWLQKSIYKVMDLFIFSDMNISEINVFTSLEISRLTSCTHLPPHSLHSHRLCTLFKSNLYYIFVSFIFTLFFHLSKIFIFPSNYAFPKTIFSSITDTAWCRIGVYKKMVTGLCQIEESISINSNHVIRLQADYHVKVTYCTALQSETLVT